MNRKTKLTIAVTTAALAVLGATAVYTQSVYVQNVHAQNPVVQNNAAQNNDAQKNDKYSLISPGGIAFADFRGYEDWSVVSSARTDEVLKVIVGSLPHPLKNAKGGWPGTSTGIFIPSQQFSAGSSPNRWVWSGFLRHAHGEPGTLLVNEQRPAWK